MYIDEFVKMLEEFDNEYVIVTHLSQRTFIQDARKILKARLSSELWEKVVLLMDRNNRFRQE
jgi:hypothetical protein